MKSQKLHRFLALAAAACLLFTLLPLDAAAYSAEKAVLTFSDSGITETAAGSGYAISGTALTISAAGTYRLKGSCAEGSVTVSKNLSDVTLILDGLTLSASTTAPLTVKKGSSVLLLLHGTSTLTDNEDASTEDTNEDFEGAAVKVKSGSSLTIAGDGTLVAVGSAKNGLKGAAETALTVDGGTLIVTAANNGIAFDGSVVLNAGSYEITAGNDGIKAVPDETDTASAGTVVIHGGSYVIRAQGDGIQAGSDLTVTDGSFDIQTMNGYQSTGFNGNTMSCKGLKASGIDTDAETEAADNQLTVTGGSFLINTADDAIHSDGDVTITGGTFTIYTKDDGVHADATLTLGVENGLDRDPEITVLSSYEGLEGSTVNAYSGKFWIVASDDGINAAGGSSNGSDPGGGWPHPGGPHPGGGGGNYALNIYGGYYYVNCEGDGLDSNGTLTLKGGNVTVFSMKANGDNSPLDADGTLTVNGATVFAAGSRGMGVNLSSSSQKYYTSSTSYAAGKILNVKVNGVLAASEKLPRAINYLLYSSPAMTAANSCTVSTASAVTACCGNAWHHNWDDGAVQTPATAEASGVMKYTCADCGAVEYKTLPQLVTLPVYAADGTTPEEPEPVVYTATFVTDDHATVNVYYKQDYAAPDEVGAASAVARNSQTGEVDGSGDGQINFAVVLEDGYTFEGITVDGVYKNLKDLSADEGIDLLYRITKVQSDLTVTIATAAKAEPEPEPEVENPFTDVADGAYYYDAVLWAVGHDPQVTNGTSETTFSPEADCTRAQVVTFLWRAAGCPAPETTQNPFTDVKQTDYAYEAILWAYENGITTGTGETTFSPSKSCTRAQVVTFLWRAAGEPAPQSTENPFADVGEGYYFSAVLWAVEQKITNGTAADRFSPSAVCTRGQIVTFLYRAN